MIRYSLFEKIPCISKPLKRIFSQLKTLGKFDVLFGTLWLCAVIAGSRGWFEIREYLLGHHEGFVEQGLFKEGVPIDDTMARIISSIKPELFQACFIEWMQSVHQLTESELVAIDGKALRGSYSPEDRHATIYMVSAYSSANILKIYLCKFIFTYLSPVGAHPRKSVIFLKILHTAITHLTVKKLFK